MDEIINSCVTALNGIGRGFCSYAAGIFIQSSVLIVLLLIIDFLLRRRVRAVFRYCVWMLVFVKLILPPTLSLPTGIGYWYGDYLSTDSSVLQQVSNVVRPEHTGALAPEDFALAAEIAKGQPSQTNPETVVPVTSAVSSLNALTWQAFVFLLWLLGVLVISVLLIQRMSFVKGLVAQSEPAKNRLLDMLNQCRRQVGIGRNIELRLTNNISCPAVCGLFKPVILIPTALLEKLSPDRLRAVLIHELVHIKRADIWVNLVQTVLQIIYFYNPFVWLANAVVRRIREQAVDEMVLVALGAGAKHYSNTLIDIAEMAFWKTSLSLRLIGVVESKKALHRRIRHMLNRPIPKSSRVGVLGTIVIIIIAAVLLPMAKAEKPKKADMHISSDTATSGSIVEKSGVVEPDPKPEPTPGMTLRRVKTEIYAQSWAAISPDGKYLCDVDWKGEIVVSELTTGEHRVLVQEVHWGDFASHFAISPDSKKVAYRWYDSEKEACELQVIGLDGSGRRTLCASDPIAPMDWSPDGKRILGIRPRPEDVKTKTYPFVTQLVSVSTEDGSLQLIRTFGKSAPNWVRSSVDLSPDGRYVAYEVMQDEGFWKGDIFLLDLDDNREIPLVKHSADDKLLGWTPDGQYIFFASDRRGTWDGWLLRVLDGNAQAMPQLAKASIGHIYPLGFTENGACYYAHRYFTGGVYTTTVDLKSGKVLSGPDAVQHGLYGCPAWSPDGQYLAYCVSRLDGLSSIHIRSMATGQERIIDTDLQKVRWLVWAPDGRSLLAAEPTGGSPGMRAVYQIDAQTGKSNILLQIEAGAIRRPELFPDGKSLLYGVRHADGYSLLTRDLKTGKEKKIFELARQRSYFPCWDLSPDGKRVLICGAGPNSPSQLKIISIEGDEVRELLPAKWDEVHYVAWAPDGQSVLFSLQKDYLHAELWQISAEGGQPQKILTTLELGFWKSLSLHPDGRRIAFHVYQGGNELWVMENFLPAE